MGTCTACGKRSPLISGAVGACVDYLRAGDPKTLAAAEDTRRRSRKEFGLPVEAPQDPDGIACGLCGRGCRLGEGRRGFCGIRLNQNGALRGGDASAARVQFYYDPLPTNCVADWVCPAGTGCGYPKYSHREGAEYGYVNLAVFYEACSFDCLFCQNWHYRSASKSHGGISAATLAEAANDRTACICYFGGDPAPQALHALEASRLALENRRGHNQGILRICWETNGSETPAVLDEMLALSLESGGCVKFDLKACNENLHQALCGPSNRRTLENFRRAARRSTASFPPPFSPQATEGGNTRRVNDFCSGKSSAGSTMTRHVAPARTPF